ncbi:MAG: uracil-DNA glycosylase [Halobacteria archaeon]|nr:uracil-DNA glycosylase [Halobacteria archaeon]
MSHEYTVENCERCDALVESRSRIVDGVGAGESGVVFVGEAPGEQEDEEGEPFVGRSGEILTRKLEDLGVERDEVRITNTVRCRPPDNRDPYKSEIENCSEYLDDEIRFYDPDVICSLGRVPTSRLVGENVTMRDVIGSSMETEIGDETYTLVPCYHPAAMLYDSSKEEDIDETLEVVFSLAQTN